MDKYEQKLSINMRNIMTSCFLICMGLLVATSIFAASVSEREEVGNESKISTGIFAKPIGFVTSLAKKVKSTAKQPSPQNEEKLQYTNTTGISAHNPYTVELLASDGSDATRQQLFAVAFELVLKQVSNNPNVVSLPEIKEAISDPARYIKSFSYMSRSNELEKKTDLFLQVKFNKKAVSHLLQKASKVVWVSNKPLVLVWLTKDDSTGKILNDESTGGDGIAEILRKKSRQYGVDIILPSLDLQDIDSVKSSDVCSFNEEKIKLASERYGVSAIVIGCVKQFALNKNWSSKWLLLQDSKKDDFSFTGMQIDSVIAEAVQAISSNLDKEMNPVFNQATQVVLRITNVNGLDQYSEVIRYLRGFKQVIKQIDLMNVSSTTIELAIDTIGGQSALVKVLGTQAKLVPNTEIEVSPPGIDFNYDWISSDNEKSQATNPQPVY